MTAERESLATQLADAARIIARVAAGASLADQAEHLSGASRAALIDLTHGTLRRYGRVQGIVSALTHRGRPEPLVEALFWCAIYALESGRYHEHTVVDQAVKACGPLERWPQKGFVNAVLRNLLREHAALEARLSEDLEAVHQHPRWWIDRLRETYPERWSDILAAGNGHPPMAVRANRRRIASDAYQAKLEREGIAAQRHGDAGFVLDKPLPMERLPGFAAGEVSVQDLGAQRAARCLDLHDGQLVLDACAAPGNKSAHILELAEVALTALDVSGGRARRIAPNLQRLGFSAKVLVGDAANAEAWWDGKPFDRILADVPCSASGIARRNPDIKWLRRAGDVGRFAEQQRALLDSLWRLLAPGGKLLYSTCSVFREENDDVVAAFIAAEPSARRLPPPGAPLPDGERSQWLPNEQHDGFFYALIHKPA